MEGQEVMPEGLQEDKGKSKNARRRTSAKPTEVEKRSLNLRVDEATYQRLTVHALMKRTTISELVMGYAREHLREYSIHRVGGKGTENP